MARADVHVMAQQVFGLQSYDALAKIIYPSPKYRAFPIQKRDGGTRVIHEPRAAVKRLQLKALAYLQQHHDKTRPCVHGFVKGRSILSNAKEHCDREPTFVLNIDLKDFFPSITFYRVRGILLKAPFGFSMEVATVMAHLCTHDKLLPQGAPTSPYLSNLVCRALDRDLMQIAKRHHAFYTRYADDITFSFSVKKAASLPSSICEFDGGILKIGKELRELIEQHSFAINDKKSRISSRRTRQEVTGLVINKFPNVRRDFLNPIRGALHAWEKYGYLSAQEAWQASIDATSAKPLKERAWPRQTRTGSPPQLSNYLWGKLLFVRMVRQENDPLYNRLAEKYNALVFRDRKDVPDFLAPTLPLHFEVEGNDQAAKALYVIEWTRDVPLPVKPGEDPKTDFLYLQGTAFAYRCRDLLITCEHVFRADTHGVKVDFEDEHGAVLTAQNIATNTESEATVLYRDIDRDLAVLKLKSPTPNMRHFVRSNEPAVGQQPAVLLGFPNWTPKRPHNVVETRVSSVFKKGALQRFEISNLIRKGNSGGPVTSSSYGVLGVAQEGAKQDEGNDQCLCVTELDGWLATLDLTAFIS